MRWSSAPALNAPEVCGVAIVRFWGFDSKGFGKVANMLIAQSLNDFENYLTVYFSVMLP